MFVAKEGLPFIVIPAIVGIILVLFGRGAAAGVPGALLIVVGLFCAFFFRDPARRVPADERSVLSPCDGTVMEVVDEGDQRVVRVFLSIFNVHLQRSPVAGTVRSVEYRPGKFLPAMRKEAHLVNEQNVITIETPAGAMVVKQIAGILARRVVCRVKPGERLEPGQRIGLIKFSSQVDLHLPRIVAVTVKPGDTIVAGETVVGTLPPRRTHPAVSR